MTADLLRALRPHQWAKNVLLALPLLASHRLGEGGLWLRLLAALIAFSAAASAGYLFNDLRDRAADRRHPHKRFRPVASGRVSPAAAAAAAGLLVLAAAALSVPLGGAFAATLGLYVVLTLAYSAYLKRKPMLDVIVLAAFYALRVVAGGAAVAIPPSPWLLALCMFLFLHLAFAKRQSEAMLEPPDALLGEGGRPYGPADLPVLQQAGVASGYLAALVVALYINNDEVRRLYARPAVLWLVCPLLLYWTGRVSLVCARGGMHHDPLLWAASDRVSYVVLGLILLVAAVAA